MGDDQLRLHCAAPEVQQHGKPNVLMYYKRRRRFKLHEQRPAKEASRDAREQSMCLAGHRHAQHLTVTVHCRAVPAAVLPPHSAALTPRVLHAHAAASSIVAQGVLFQQLTNARDGGFGADTVASRAVLAMLMRSSSPTVPAAAFL